ncbi:drug/metabolite transporter (DMT)-like permease [Deinobacterium chartae]|uniref:Drug/metabolite transporter (DMT)-like permease n=1 Tax=Deinobacterium chartae TaxID=521158 RepID=A0A841HY91_9DEIO|nr:DMT family transporter [Deinobacterium chartae]MBB6098367.1 drug/metabolite transporter (DMT)-like permease [Deinobacterium chartae]
MDLLSFGAIAITIVFWASSFAGIKAGLEAFSPEHLTLYRFLVASAVLAVYALVARIRPLAPRDMLRTFGISLLGITVYHLALNFGELSVPAGTASLIIAAGPVFTALLATAFMGERLSVLGWTGILISLSGVVLIVMGRGESVAFTQGALLILLSAVVTSIYFVFQKPLVLRYGSTRFTVYSLMLGTLPLLVFWPGLGSEIAQAGLEANLAVIYIGVFPAALAYLTWAFALGRVGASVTSSFLYVSPVLAIAIAYLWLGEVPKPVSLIGGAIAVAGVILVNTLGRTPRANLPKTTSST